MLTLNTNIVKLRSDRWASMETEITAGGSAGDFILPHSGAFVVGVLVNDTAPGEDGVIVYKADKIIVPCSFDDDKLAGEPVLFEIGENQVSDAGTIFCGVLTEPATDSDTECEIDLIGIAINYGAIS